jgi:hypothetical protein
VRYSSHSTCYPFLLERALPDHVGDLLHVAASEVSYFNRFNGVSELDSTAA